MRTLFSIALALSATACSSTPASSDDTAKFVGQWTYQPGSTVVIDCPGAPATTMDLTHAGPGNRPAFFTMSSASGAAVHEVDARGCQYDWSIAGNVATAAPGQSCATFPDGRGGNQLVHLQSATKSTSDGASMTVDGHFTPDGANGCAIHVQGTAKKS